VLALWPDRIVVIISPERIVLIHTRGLFFKRKVIAEKSTNFQLTEAGHVDIPHVITKLTELLSELVIQSGELDVLISSHFVRLSLLPPVTQALKPEEQLKRVQLHFERIYGGAAKKWEFSSSSLKFEQPTLAAAIDNTLLSGLRNIADVYSLNLVSVEPSLMFILNYWKSSIVGTQAKFILVEQNCCSILNLDNLKIDSLSQLPCKSSLISEDFQTLLLREALKDGESLQRKVLYLFSPKNPSLSLDSNIAKLHHLSLPVAGSAHKFTKKRLLKLLGDI